MCKTQDSTRSSKLLNIAMYISRIRLTTYKKAAVKRANCFTTLLRNMLKAMLCVLYHPRSNLCCKLRSSALNKLTQESSHIRDLGTSHYSPPGGGGWGGGGGFRAKRAVI